MSESEALNLAIGCIIASDLTMDIKNEVIRCLLNIEEQNSDLREMVSILEENFIEKIEKNESPMDSIKTSSIPMKGN
jgi:hypothetical protein